MCKDRKSSKDESRGGRNEEKFVIFPSFGQQWLEDRDLVRYKRRWTYLQVLKLQVKLEVIKICN